MKKTKLAFPHYIYPTQLLLTPQLLVPVHAIMAFLKVFYSLLTSLFSAIMLAHFSNSFSNKKQIGKIERKSDWMRKISIQKVPSIPKSKG